MKIRSIFDSLSSRKLRHGGYATLMIVAGLAIVIVVNLLVDQVPGKLDLTQNRLYSLSDETWKVLDGLKADVTITQIGKVGGEDVTVRQILKKYAARSKRVKLQTIDPERNPAWSRKYDPTSQGLTTGSIVVAMGDKHKTISPYDMYNYDYSDPNSPQLTSLSVEQRVTSALIYVTAERNVMIYVLQGNGEQTLSSLNLSSAVGNENYETKEISLLTVESIPADADMLLVLAPKYDIPSKEIGKIRSYLAQGGRAAFLLELPQEPDSMPNLSELLKSYGIAMKNVLVVEGDSSQAASNNPLILLPRQEYHDILSPLRANDLPVVISFTQAIQTLELKKKTLKVEPLLSSSVKSWGKTDYTNVKTLAREKGDVDGPFTLAVAITDQSSDPNRKDTKLVVIASASFLSEDITTQVPSNTDFFLNSLGWLKEKKDSISIRAKSLLTMRLNINAFQSLLLSGIVVILMPLLVLGTGFVVWIRRRHL